MSGKNPEKSFETGPVPDQVLKPDTQPDLDAAGYLVVSYAGPLEANYSVHFNVCTNKVNFKSVLVKDRQNLSYYFFIMPVNFSFYELTVRPSHIFIEKFVKICQKTLLMKHAKAP